jgi:hypothetical protein
VLKSQVLAPEPVYREIYKTTWHVHKKPGSSDSVCVVYETIGNLGLEYREWIFPETIHPRGQYAYWQWCKDAHVAPCTKSSEMVEQCCPVALAIWTLPDGKFTKVVRRKWA